jgi:hypothetical protein
VVDQVFQAAEPLGAIFLSRNRGGLHDGWSLVDWGRR